MGNGITRRQFLAGAAAVPLLAVNRAFAAEDRPSFAFILTDDHRWDWLGCAGHPWLRTPNIDRIAREGARFTNAFVTTSLCSPSRASFLTGRYAHSHGVINNQLPLDPAVPTFPQVLQRAGYDTALIGKWHMDGQEGPQPGFSRWVSPKGQGLYHDPMFNIDGRNVETPGYFTDIVTKYAVEWLRQPRKSPFCLYLAHKAVHGNFECAVRHSKLYSDIQFTPRANINDTREGKPQWVRNAKRFPPGSEDYAALVQRVKDYSRTLMAVDESVGRILRTLEELGVIDSTVVVFAGDNGFFFGEHGLLDKRAAYEESIRIPLLMRYPRLIRPGSLIEPIALNIDMCPTFLDLAGIELPKGVEGRSWRPILSGRKTGWRGDFLYEYFYDSEAKKRPPMRGVRTERWKYITYPDSDNCAELYDLKNDPLEMRNLAGEPSAAGVAAEMKARMAEFGKGADHGSIPA